MRITRFKIRIQLESFSDFEIRYSDFLQQYSITIIIKGILCAGICQPVFLNISADDESVRPVIDVFNSVVAKITVNDITFIRPATNRSYYRVTISSFYKVIWT